MEKMVYWYFLSVVAAAVWGYIVGMLDYRLMINTAASCSCWIKFGVLMGVLTLIVAGFATYFLFFLRKKNKPAESDEDLP